VPQSGGLVVKTLHVNQVTQRTQSWAYQLPSNQANSASYPQ